MKARLRLIEGEISAGNNNKDLLKEAHCRNIKEYNEKFTSRKLNPEKGHQYLPFIVLVVDEFADLIMTAGKEVEMPIARIAQLARAVGIHMIIATPRPYTPRPNPVLTVALPQPARYASPWPVQP